MKKLILTVTTIAAALLMTACGGSGGPTPSTPPPVVTPTPNPIEPPPDSVPVVPTKPRHQVITDHVKKNGGTIEGYTFSGGHGMNVKLNGKLINLTEAGDHKYMVVDNIGAELKLGKSNNGKYIELAQRGGNGKYFEGEINYDG